MLSPKPDAGTPGESIECPLCSGEGSLKRTEFLDRLGVKDFARVAQLSAEETFRLLTHKHNHEYHAAWSRFEMELAKHTAEIRERHDEELRMAKSERDDLTCTRSSGAPGGCSSVCSRRTDASLLPSSCCLRPRHPATCSRCSPTRPRCSPSHGATVAKVVSPSRVAGERRRSSYCDLLLRR